jgi:ankyrin repeat protein
VRSRDLEVNYWGVVLARRSLPQVVSLLLDADADANAADAQERTPLFLAQKARDEPMVALLVGQLAYALLLSPCPDICC